MRLTTLQHAAERLRDMPRHRCFVPVRIKARRSSDEGFLTVEEIATVLRIFPGTLRKRLLRGGAQLPRRYGRDVAVCFQYRPMTLRKLGFC